MQRPLNGYLTAVYDCLQKGYDSLLYVDIIFLTQIYNYNFSYTTIFIVFFSKKFPTTEIGRV